MTERVEEIRRWHHGQHALCPACDLLTALAQAERERETMRSELANLRVLHEANCHYKSERDAARAEVERLTELLELSDEHEAAAVHLATKEAEAALARVRAIADEALTGLIDVREALTYFERIRAALEGRG